MAVLRLYRLFAFLAAPLLRFRLRRRAAAGKEEPSRIDERFGHASVQRPHGHLVWVHAASVGETKSVLPLIDDLLTAYPDRHILLTTGTVTSAEIVAAHQNCQGGMRHRLIHQYAPLDRSAWVKRFLAYWRPQAAFWVESEIWPNTLLACAAQDLKPVMINGRMSQSSFKRWQKFPRIARLLLGKFAVLTAQDEVIAARLRQLGVENVVTLGNLKLDAPFIGQGTKPGRTATGFCRPRCLARCQHPSGRRRANRRSASDDWRKRGRTCDIDCAAPSRARRCHCRYASARRRITGTALQGPHTAGAS